MSKILNILEGEDKDFRYYSAKGHASTPLEFGQKSIPYGMDEQGGGSSKQPYIERTQGRLSFSIEQLTNSLVDINKQESAVVDVNRMTKWFTTPLTNGILFNAKQVHQSNLQERSYQYSIGADLNTNPKQTFKTALNNLVDSVGNGLVNTNHILKQVGGDGFNLHFSNPLLDKYRLLENTPGETGNNTNGFEDKNVQGRSNYGNFNRQKTYGLGNVGQPRLDRTDPFGEGITQGNLTPTVDEVNFSPILNKEKSDEIKFKDFIPFYITVIDNNNTTENKYIHFRAFIDNFSDNFSSEWASHKIMGRGENFYTYNGFNRQINLAFKIHAQSKQELIPLYEKLNYLASVAAPDYDRQNGFMKGNLITLTIGDYMVEVEGILNNFALSIPNTYPWDIGRNKDGVKDGAALPTIIDISTFTFTPLHYFVPEIGAPFINNYTQTQKFNETVDLQPLEPDNNPNKIIELPSQEFTYNYSPSNNRHSSS